MAIRGDSYGSVDEVRAYTRHMLDGSNNFDESTTPTRTEVERFIDRASGALNVAMNNAGLTTPVTNSTAKLMLSDWVTMRACAFVEMTHRGVESESEFRPILRTDFRCVLHTAQWRVSRIEGLAKLPFELGEFRQKGL